MPRSAKPMHPQPGMPNSGRFKDQLVTLFWAWLIVLAALSGLAGLVVWMASAWQG